MIYCSFNIQVEPGKFPWFVGNGDVKKSRHGVVLARATKYYKELQSTKKYYKVQICTTKYESVLQSITRYYKLLQSTIE